MMKTNNTASSHEEIVQKVVRYLRSRFFLNIRADAEGVASPPKAFSINGEAPLVPDVTVGNDFYPKHIFEVETSDTICNDCAGERWKVFSHIANECGGDFSVVVPKGMADVVTDKLEEHGLDGKIWEI